MMIEEGLAQPDLRDEGDRGDLGVGGSVSWGPGVTFGGGVSVMGVAIDPRTQLPIPNSQVKTQITTWVDFKFKENGLSAMPFVEESIKQVQRIFDDLKKHL